MNGKTTLSCWRTFFPTSYHATELAAVSPGKTVAVFGAGPVGLLAAYSALLKGAAEVYVVDNVAERLEKAKELGATCRFQPGRSSRADFRNSSKTSWNSAEPSSRRRKAAGCGLCYRCSWTIKIPQVFGRDTIPAVPLPFEIGSFLGEHFGQPLHRGCHQTVGVFDGLTGFVHKSGLDFLPAAAQIFQLSVWE